MGLEVETVRAGYGMMVLVSVRVGIWGGWEGVWVELSSGLRLELGLGFGKNRVRVGC